MPTETAPQILLLLSIEIEPLLAVPALAVELESMWIELSPIRPALVKMFAALVF